MQRIICIWLPLLASERLIRANPDLAHKPFVLVTREANQNYVSALSRAAGNMGFAPGISLTDIRAAFPDISYFDADPGRDRKTIRGLLRWASRFTPNVSREGVEDLFLDITGASHLFGGEEILLENIQTKLGQLGFSARLGLANTKAAAWGFAHFGPDRANISSKDLREAAKSLPVEALQMGHGATSLCRQLGLKTIGALLILPRRTLANRIGLDGIKNIDQFFGEAAEIIGFARHRQRLIEEMQFPNPIGHSAGVEMALERLLTKLCERLRSMNKGIRKAVLTLEKVDHQMLDFSINTVSPNCDVRSLQKLFAHHFEQLDVGFGIERMIIHAANTGPLPSHQMSLEDAHGDGHKTALEGLINSLSNMFGYENVQCFKPANSHIPEKTFSREYALYPTKDQCWSMAACKRPLLLFKNPVGVWHDEDGGSHVPKTIIWQNKECSITPLTGPERIEADWWYDDPKWRDGSRDYWWVKTGSGALLWLYSVADIVGRKWFAHGRGS